MRALLLGCWMILLGGFADLQAEAAEPRVLARAGNWQAYLTAAEHGGALCGVAQFSGRYGFMLKYDSVNDTAFLHLTRQGWTVPETARMAVEFVVDGRLVWQGDFSGTDAPHMIEGYLDAEEARGFIGAFAHGRELAVRFPSGSEAPWQGSLRGTLRVTSAFLDCMRQTAETAAREEGQPHAGGDAAAGPPANGPAETGEPRRGRAAPASMI